MSEKRRDSERTRRRLLDAARVRFIRLGYRATTVRDIAEDAGVDPALIYRYFTSKQGMLDACLAELVSDAPMPDPAASPRDVITAAILGEIAESHGGERTSQLLLLLTSSDHVAKAMVTGSLTGAAERIAAAAECPTDVGADSRLFRAELILAAVVGIGMLRAQGVLDHLAAASADALAPVVRDLVSLILGPSPPYT